jgi:hypothetical protein
MELYFAASGVAHELDYFEKNMQFLPFELPYTDAKGTKKKQLSYGMLSPIKLYRYVFPKEALDIVLKTLDLPNKSYPKFNLQARALRLALNAKKIPKPKDDAVAYNVGFKNVAIKGIGIKEDPIQTFANGCTHEAI